MTVAAESDFQSRPVIFRINQASVFRQLSVRGRHLNREHRRANVYIRKHSEFESRWLRVERKALVSCPTLNERLSISKNYSRNSAPRSRRNRSRIFACAAFTSSFVSVRLRSRYVNLYARDFRAAPTSPPLNTSNNSTLSKSGSSGSWIARRIFSCEISSGTIIAISRVTAGNFSISRNFFLGSSGTKIRSYATRRQKLALTRSRSPRKVVRRNRSSDHRRKRRPAARDQEIFLGARKDLERRIPACP